VQRETGPARPADRPHPAAAHRRLQRGQAHRRGTQDTAGRCGGLQGALPGPPVQGRLRQADDRRHPARRNADRPRPARLRHHHHRRGARAQPEHRLPARLPAPAAAAPARPQGGRDLRHHRRRPFRALLRLGQGPGAGAHGLGPHLSGGGALAPVRGKPRLRPEHRHRRRGGRTLARPGRRRHPGVPAGRARDPRGGRPPAQTPEPHSHAAQRRGAAAVRAPVAGRAGPHLPGPQRAAHRALHQRGRDLAHGARHPFRDRCRHRPREALQLPPEGGAAHGGAHQPGRGQPARRPLRPCRRRDRDPAVRRSRLRRAPGVHRPRDPAQLARGRDPAHEGLAPGRGGRLRLHRGTAEARHRRWLSAAGRTQRGGRGQRTHAHRSDAIAPAAGPARGPHDSGGAAARRARRGAGDRLGPERAGCARPPAGQTGAGGPGARQVRRREERVQRHAQALEMAGGHQGWPRQGPQAQPPAVRERAARELRQCAARARVARHPQPAAHRGGRAPVEAQRQARQLRATAPGHAGRAAGQRGSEARNRRLVPGRARHQVPPPPGREPEQAPRSLDRVCRAGGDHAPVRARHRRCGWSRWVGT
jgi:hypothetical protein